MKSEELKAVTEWFDTYVQTFARNNGGLHPLLQLKADHSKRVAGNAESRAREIEWAPAETRAAQAIGILHDVGRFPQFAERPCDASHAFVSYRGFFDNCRRILM